MEKIQFKEKEQLNSAGKMTALGRHLLLELKDCDAGLLNDADFLLKAVVDAAETAGATVLSKHAHHFQPQGVSVLVMIAESHVSLHTWPENNYAAADIFTCGTRVNPELAAESLIKDLKPGNTSILEIRRGILT